MKKYFIYYAVIYYHEEYKKNDTKYFFTKEEAEKWLEKKDNLGKIKKWQIGLNTAVAIIIFEKCVESRKEVEKYD